jgi:hypothetical protein
MSCALYIGGKWYYGRDRVDCMEQFRGEPKSEPPAAPPPIPLCIHFIDAESVPPELAPNRRDWRYCPKGHGEKGMVCVCTNCGPRCPDYEVDVP